MNNEFWRDLKREWYKARANYLNEAHTKEEEVFFDSWGNQCFFLDGYRIYIPQELCTTRDYLKYVYRVK